MSHDVSWPPTSPRAALLSSPSGRKRYQSYLSPSKPSITTRALLGRPPGTRSDDDRGARETPEEPDEDEETLQLQLAAIEAKLKLKKLQQHKAKGTATTPANPSRASTPLSRTQSLAGHQNPRLPPSRVEVGVSPTKRILPPPPKSPSRVLLGIDKGARGADVSLRRANTTAGVTRARRDPFLPSDRPSSRSSATNTARDFTPKPGSATGGFKSFNRRMAEARDRDRGNETRREEIIRSRSTRLALDQAELDRYRAAAEDSRRLDSSRSPVKHRVQVTYERDHVLESTRQAALGSRKLAKGRDVLDGDSKQPDSSLFEGLSQLHLSSRILPHSFLKRTLPTDKFTTLRVPDLLKHVTSPDFELPETICDYVVCGVIASKSSPMDQRAPAAHRQTAGKGDWERRWEDGSTNQRRFMAFTVTDLKWTVDLYLFGTAVPRYHRLTPGTVVAILNPGIMPPKPGKTDTGAFSLTLSSGEETVLEIGTARDLGFCKTLKKDGQPCGSWLDAAKTEVCEYHLNAQLTKTRAQRMGVNTGTNGFGSRRHKDFHDRDTPDGLLARDGHKYDFATGSHVYISRSHSAAAPHGTGRAYDTASVLAPEGNLSRDRDTRVRKHLAAVAKEREIAKKLGSGQGLGDAGAEYLKAKANAATAVAGHDAKSREKENLAPSLRPNRAAILSDPLSSTPSFALGGSRKRTAADVRLSPVKPKKTRFLTARGIREAGRESVGATVAGRGDGSASDDDLEIV